MSRNKSGIDKVDKFMNRFYDNVHENDIKTQVLFMLKDLKMCNYIKKYSFYPDSYNPISANIETNYNQYGRKSIVFLNKKRELELFTAIVEFIERSFVNK